VERGRLIARSGLPQSGVPACLACHGQDAAGLFPRLAGQHAPYLVSQLRAFRSGSHGRTAAGDIMEVIAAPLTDAQIGDAAAYFSSLETRALRADAAAPAGREAR